MDESNKTAEDIKDEMQELRQTIDGIESGDKELHLLSSITKQVADSVITTDLNYRITYVNPAFQQLYGYSQDELMGQSPVILNVEPNSSQIQKDIYEAVSSGKVWRGEAENRRKDGSIFPCEMTIFPLKDEQGNVFAYAGTQKDITERKQIEQALKKSEERFKDIAESMSDWIWEVDAESVYTYCSDNVESILGYRRDEIIGKTPFDLMPTDEADRVSKIFSDIARDKKPFRNLENWNLTKDGRRVCLATSGVPIIGDNDEYLGYRGVESDITQRKQTERQLIESQERFDLAQAIGRVGVWDWSLITSELIWSDETYRILGLSPGECKPDFEMFFDIVHPDDREPIKEAVDAAIHQGKPYNIDCRIIWKDGSEHVANAQGEVRFDTDGKPLQMLGTFQNITERKQAEESLLESSVRFRELMQQSPVVFELYDIDGLQTDVNKAYEILWGFPASHTVNKFNVLKSKEVENTGLMVYVKKAYAGKSVTVPEYEYDSTGETEGMGMGRKRWLRTRIFPLKNKDGKVINIVITHEDVSDRKYAEQDREELFKELAATNKELQSIVYVASHDLKSPLISIYGFSALLDQSCKEITGIVKSLDLDDEVLQRILSLADEDIPKSLGFIFASTKKMAVLIDGLLQVSRVGTVHIKIEPLEVNNIVDDVCEVMDFQLKEKDVEVHYDGLPGCLGDKNMINQLFSNLIGNALKYLDTDRKGKINISGTIDDSQSIYCIEDNGVGIRQDHQSKIFELFHRLNPDDAVGGEGLGLSIVTRILDRNNGSIRVESEEGKGSKFFVSLPAV